MRCIAIAQAWQNTGGEATFISHCESEVLQRRIADEGSSIITIDKVNSISADLAIIERLAADGSMRIRPNNTWIVIDGYHFDTEYQRRISLEGYRLFVIDDFNHLSHYHADILLNPNISATKLEYSCNEDTVKLLGCKYALLRKEFSQQGIREKVITKEATRILITLGGSDPLNITINIIKALNCMGRSGLDVKIIVGPSNQNLISLNQELSLSTFSYQLLVNVKDMPNLMSWADIAVSSASSTFWELAYFGVPSIIITLAENQIGIGDAAEDLGAAIHLGWYENLQTDHISNVIDGIIKDFALRKRLSSNTQKLIDGRGAERAASRLIQ